MSTKFSLSLLAAGVIAGLTLSSAAFAFDTGGSSNSTPPNKNCAKGYVWSDKANGCVRASSGLVPDKDMVEQGRQLALAGNYSDAISVLEAVQPDNARALTYLGYSYRKLGDLDRGIAFYHAALAIDPNNVDTREYLGEGYVSAGRNDLAKIELAKVQTLCGTECEEYQALNAAIEGRPTE